MVEPGETKVKSKGVEEKKVFKFKKKNQRNNNSSKRVDRDVPELLKVVEFSMGRNGPDFVLKGTREIAAVCIDTIQVWSRRTEMLETRETDHLHST